MQFFDYILADFNATLGKFTMIGPRFSWLFLLSAIVIALIFYRRTASQKWSVKEAIKQTFPSEVLLHPSSLLDYRYGAVNYFVRLLAFGIFMISGAQVASNTQGLFETLFGAQSPDTTPPGLWFVALITILLVLALDFGLFMAHFIMHKVPVLWEFHKVHHSAEMLTPITVLRMHPVDMIINSWIVAICVGIVNGSYVYLYPDPEQAKWLFMSNTIVFTFYFFGYHLRHSHVWIMFPKGIRQIISSPALHLIHHSTERKHWDKNFGRIFILWDRIVGAAYIPKEREEITFGIGTSEDGEYDTVYKLYMLPFRKALALLQKKPAS